MNFGTRATGDFRLPLLREASRKRAASFPPESGAARFFSICGEAPTGSRHLFDDVAPTLRAAGSPDCLRLPHGEGHGQMSR